MSLNVTLIQPDLEWEMKEKNLTRLEKMIFSLTIPTDLIVLPELFSTGFTMNTVSLAEEMEGPTMRWLHRTASAKSACITGSLIIKDGDHYFNRLIFIHPSGQYQYYDKRHLFRIGNENKFYKPGTQRLIVELNDWRIMPLICYDLRFPVWSRNKMDYDMVIYVASWPETRKEVWEALLRARAIENHAFVFGVSRVGKDGNHVSHAGDSMAFDYKGNQILRLPSGIEKVETVTIEKSDLLAFRKAFPVFLDADEFTIQS